MTSIFLVEREIHVRDALCLLIKYEVNMQIVGTADHTESILTQVCKLVPDVILLDWNLSGIHHEQLLTALRQCCPTTRIVATSVRLEHEHAAIKVGFDAFLLKQLLPDQFISALRSEIDSHLNEIQNRMH